MSESVKMLWGTASMRWAPEHSPRSMHREVEGFFEEYAAILLREQLIEAVMGIAKGSLDLEVGVYGGKREEGNFEPGRIVITADELTEHFDAAELRQLIQAYVDSAEREGSRLADEDEARAKRFLNELAQQPKAD